MRPRHALSSFGFRDINLTDTPNRWRRYAQWDERPLRLDKFAVEDAAHGFSAFTSPADPKPAIAIKAGRIASMDGVLAHDFDMIDEFIARHHIDPAIAPEAMAMDSGVGTCGKEGQSVPVGVGQPTLRIDGLTVGGTA